MEFIGTAAEHIVLLAKGNHFIAYANRLTSCGAGRGRGDHPSLQPQDLGAVKCAGMVHQFEKYGGPHIFHISVYKKVFKKAFKGIDAVYS